MTMLSLNNNNNNNNPANQFGDTTLTKVFVGGLAWETPKEALQKHFDAFGDILEAVIISDKITGRSKGYGFVTFKEAEAAKKACQEATPMINGRRANCNLASLGARKPRSSSATTPPPPPPHGSNLVVPRSASPANHVQWYYPAPAGTPPATASFHPHHHAVPFYGYSPTYIAADVSYNHKMGGAYMNGHGHGHGHYSPVYHHHHHGIGHAMVGANTLMPMYPMYHQYHQSHMFHPTTAGHVSAMPAIISKPPSNSVCLAVE